MSVTAPIDRDIAALREALSDGRVRRRVINAGVPMRTVQNFLAGGQPSVQTIRLLQSVEASSTGEGSETDGELAYELIALAARARYLTERIDETVARVDALSDRLGGR